MKPAFENLNYFSFNAAALKDQINNEQYYAAPEPIFIQPANNVQYLEVEEFQDILSLFDNVERDKVPAVRSVIANYYGERKGALNPVENPQDAQFAVFSAQVVVDLEVLQQQDQNVFGEAVEEIVGKSVEQAIQEKEKELEMVQQAMDAYQRQAEANAARLEEEIAALKSQS